MAKAKQFVFRLEAYTPDTIPMERLAECLAHLAKLLGEEPSVHFVKLARGSAKAICRIEREAVPQVDDRLTRVKVGEGPPEARRAARDIDNMLRDDNASGALLDDEGAEVIPFPGNRRIRATAPEREDHHPDAGLGGSACSRGQVADAEYLGRREGSGHSRCWHRHASSAARGRATTSSLESSQR